MQNSQKKFFDKAMIVDDDDVIRMLACETLEAVGFEVISVDNGADAVSMFNSLLPDIILLDLMMPGMDGFQTCREIRSKSGGADVPILIMTGLDDLESITSAYQSGATDFITKPIQWLVLPHRVQYLIRSGKANAERKRVETKLLKLTQAVDQSASVIVVTDIEGRIEYANPKFTEITGYSLPEALGQNPRILSSDEQPPEFYQNLWQTIKSGNIWKGEFHNRRKDGSQYWEDATIAPVFDSTGNIISFIAVKEDITARKSLEAAELDQRRLAEALRETAMAVNASLMLEDVLECIFDSIDKIAHFDAAILMLIEGDSVCTVRERNQMFLQAGENDNNLRQFRLTDLPFLSSVIETKQPCLISNTLTAPDWPPAFPGAESIKSFVSVPIEIKGQVAGVINLGSASADFFVPQHAQRLMAFASQAAIAIENARLYERTHVLSITDPLTRLYNRRYFFENARIEFERIRRYGGTLSVMMMDIDHFKDLNDTFGHAKGDLVLNEIAQRIKSCIRTVDIAARYGGEEFVILMPETDLNKASQVAERVRQSVGGQPFVVDDTRVMVTLSLGVAEIGPSHHLLDDLLKDADQALYAAKASGRNRVEIFNNA